MNETRNSDYELSEDLVIHVLSHLQFGCHRVDESLGIQKMPEGYALMLNNDETYFYWLRYDGVESYRCWDKWKAYRAARADEFNRLY